ncbi:MAG: CPBP family intramembrane glutamic endopeptidase [Thermodesulfobacteriota bacterium]|nr:CPBP family intramembrane glutamic endopeptidase [Thermodesulfobacteriota bacterium]
MDTPCVRVRTVLAALTVVVMVEIVMGGIVRNTGLPGIAVMAAGRCGQVLLILAGVRLFEHTLTAVGLSRSSLGRGVMAGIAWAVGFGGLISIAGVALLVMGINPLGIFAIHPVGHPMEVGLYYLTGVVIAPIAEEVLFRGVIYGFFRQFGIVTAIVLTTVIFAALHLTTTTVPVIQAVGGVLFCIAYEKEKNLMAPIVIHMMGNGAILAAGLVP